MSPPTILKGMQEWQAGRFPSHLETGRLRAVGGARKRLEDADPHPDTRRRAWKVHLQAIADRLGMAVTVCHYPPGTSKGTELEHRLFSFIRMNWRGRPLLSYEAVVNLMGGTTTESGLRVKAFLDTREYQAGQKITHAAMRPLRLKPISFTATG